MLVQSNLSIVQPGRQIPVQRAHTTQLTTHFIPTLRFRSLFWTRSILDLQPYIHILILFDYAFPTRMSVFSRAHIQNLGPNHTFPLHASCSRCHHFLSKHAVPILKTIEETFDVTCPVCGRLLVRLGRSSTQSSLASQETIVPDTHRSNGTVSQANSILVQPRSSTSSNSRSHSLRWAPDDRVPSEPTQATSPRIHLSDVDEISSDAENHHDIHDSIEDESVIGNGNLNHAERPTSTPTEHVEQNRSARKRTRLGYLGKRATFVVRKASSLMRKVRFLTSRKPGSRRTSLASRRSTSTLNIMRTRIDQAWSVTPMAPALTPDLTPDLTQDNLHQSNVSSVPSNLEKPVAYQAAPLSGQDVTTLGSDSPATVTTVPAKEEALRQKRRELSHRARLRDLQLRSCPCAPMCDCHPIYGRPRPISRSQTDPLNPLVSVPSAGEVLRTDYLYHDLQQLDRTARGDQTGTNLPRDTRSSPRTSQGSVSIDSAATTEVNPGSDSLSASSPRQSRPTNSYRATDQAAPQASSRPITSQLDTQINGHLAEGDHVDADRTPTQRTIYREDEMLPGTPLPDTDSATLLMGVGQWPGL